MTKHEFLEVSPVFDGLTQQELVAIGQRLFEKKLARSEMVFVEDTTPNSLYFVAEGAVKLFKTSIEGKEQTISIVRPNELFNVVAILDGELIPVNAQALGTVTLYGLPRDELDAILQSYPKLARNIMRMLAQRTRLLISLIEDLSFRSVTSRVAKILLENLINSSKDTAPRLTQREIASMAGTAREVVARSLKQLENAELIEIRQHQIAIRNKKGLEQIVELGL